MSEMLSDVLDRVLGPLGVSDTMEAAILPAGHRKLGNVMDYLREERNVDKCWEAAKPCKGVDEGDRMAFCLIRQIFGDELRRIGEDERLVS